jgi:hypothetical protein
MAVDVFMLGDWRLQNQYIDMYIDVKQRPRQKGNAKGRVENVSIFFHGSGQAPFIPPHASINITDPQI